MTFSHAGKLFISLTPGMTRKTDKNPFSGVIFPQTRNVAAEAKQRAQIFILYLFCGDCVLGQHQASQPGSISACVLNGSLLLLHSHLDTSRVGST